VNIANLQIGVADRDHSAPKLTSLEENKKLSSALNADAQSKIFLRFEIKDKQTNALVRAHQAFVRFTHVKSGKEIVFLAEATTTNTYNADLDVSTNAKNFRQTSGLYSIDLIVSDPLIENPMIWKLSDIQMNFGEDSTLQSSAASDKQNLYIAKPEIKHLFRQPDPTPPKIVSTIFAGLCLAPFVIMIVMWLNIGFNLSKFSFSVYAIIFQLTLAGIFVLFYCYWTFLNMFQTVRYLAMLGVIAFLSGNKMLKNLALKK